MNKKPRSFYGWWVLAALFIIGCIGPLARYSLSAFFPPISTELGWSRSLIGSAQSLSLWVYSFVSLFTGWMADRYGGRKTILVGGVITLAGWMLLSSVYSLWQLFVYYGIVMAISVSFTHLVPLQSTSRKWFVKHGGLAGGIVGSAFALGTAIFSPILTSTAGDFGWRNVSMVAAVASGIPIIILAYFVIRDTPESVGQHPDGISMPALQEHSLPSSEQWRVRDSLRTGQFWILFWVYSLLGIVYNGILGHLVIWSVDLGSSVTLAGIFVTLFNGPSIIARVMGGFLGDKYGKRKILFIGICFSLVIVLIGYKMVTSPLLLGVFAVVLGLSMGFSNTLFAPYLGDLFGREYVGSLFGILTLGWGLIGGVGPLVWGAIYDHIGSYNLALLVSAACYAVTLVILMLIKPLKKKDNYNNR
jgi:MFS family permease